MMKNHVGILSKDLLVFHGAQIERQDVSPCNLGDRGEAALDPQLVEPHHLLQLVLSVYMQIRQTTRRCL